MKATALSILGLVASLMAIAKEYPTQKELEATYRDKELNRRHWAKANRENGDLIWQEACAFNFSYATGFAEYQTFDQREDFYEWLSGELRKKGHEVKWVDMALEVMDRLESVASKDDLLGLNANLANKLVFDSTFARLQELYKMPEPLQGAKAKEWDEKMIAFEQEEIIQVVYNRMDIVTLEKADRMAKGKGLYALCVPKNLRFEGDLRKPADRIQFANTKLLPYVAEKSNAEFNEELNKQGIKAEDKRSKKAAERYLKSVSPESSEKAK